MVELPFTLCWCVMVSWAILPSTFEMTDITTPLFSLQLMASRRFWIDISWSEKLESRHLMCLVSEMCTIFFTILSPLVLLICCFDEKSGLLWHWKIYIVCQKKKKIVKISCKIIFFVSWYSDMENFWTVFQTKRRVDEFPGTIRAIWSCYPSFWQGELPVNLLNIILIYKPVFMLFIQSK